ncbi:hypothetical protein ACFX14_036129 [Malus domestica]
MRIALGAAKGLAFLHEEVQNPVIYRDFKTSNILLDADYNAKLSDLELAKDGTEGDRTHVSTRVMGTYGYAAPKYVMTGECVRVCSVTISSSFINIAYSNSTYPIQSSTSLTQHIQFKLAHIHIPIQ